MFEYLQSCLCQFFVQRVFATVLGVNVALIFGAVLPIEGTAGSMNEFAGAVADDGLLATSELSMNVTSKSKTPPSKSKSTTKRNAKKGNKSKQGQGTRSEGKASKETRVRAKNKRNGTSKRKSTKKSDDTKDIRRVRLPRYFGRLGLDEEQREAVAKTQVRYAKKLEKLEQQLAEIREQMNDSLRDLLTSEQRRDLKQLESR